MKRSEQEDPEKGKAIPGRVVRALPLCLDEPEHLIIVRQFGSGCIEITRGTWVERSSFNKVKNSIITEIQAKLFEHATDNPFPHFPWYSGSQTFPVPVVLNEKEVAR